MFMRKGNGKNNGGPPAPSMLEAGGGPGANGQGGDWGVYTAFQQKIYEPVFREINDRFKYANLDDPDRQQLVSMLADLGDMQLQAPCNQYSTIVRALHDERDTIMMVLENAGMPVQRPAFDEDGLLLDLVPNPNFTPIPYTDDDLDGEEEAPPAGQRPARQLIYEGAEVTVEVVNAETEAEGDEEEEEEQVADRPDPEEGYTYTDDDILVDPQGEPEFLNELRMDMDDPFVLDRLEIFEQGYKAIWYVPNTPDECYERMDAIQSELRIKAEDRNKAMREGYFYDSGPLLDQLTMAPEDRDQGDLSYLYPFFYRKCFAVAAITPEDLHAHLQAINADTVLERHGGTFLNPRAMTPWGNNQNQPPPIQS